MEEEVKEILDPHSCMNCNSFKCDDEKILKTHIDSCFTRKQLVQAGLIEGYTMPPANETLAKDEVKGKKDVGKGKGKDEVKVKNKKNKNKRGKNGNVKKAVKDEGLKPVAVKAANIGDVLECRDVGLREVTPPPVKVENPVVTTVMVGGGSEVQSVVNSEVLVVSEKKVVNDDGLKGDDVLDGTVGLKGDDVLECRDVGLREVTPPPVKVENPVMVGGGADGLKGADGKPVKGVSICDGFLAGSDGFDDLLEGCPGFNDLQALIAEDVTAFLGYEGVTQSVSEGLYSDDERPLFDNIDFEHGDPEISLKKLKKIADSVEKRMRDVIVHEKEADRREADLNARSNDLQQIADFYQRMEANFESREKELRNQELALRREYEARTELKKTPEVDHATELKVSHDELTALKLDYTERVKKLEALERNQDRQLKESKRDLESYFAKRQKALLAQQDALVEKQCWNMTKQGSIARAWVRVQQMLLSRWEQNLEKEKELTLREDNLAAQEEAFREKSKEN